MKVKVEEGQDRHHILPSSRGGKTNPTNICVVDKGLHHYAYHKLFSNLTPDEIIRYLVEDWWNGQWQWVEIALNEKKGVKCSRKMK